MKSNFLNSGYNAFRDNVATHNAAKDVDENAFDVRVRGNDFEGSGYLLGCRAAPYVQEVCRRCTVQFDSFSNSRNTTSLAERKRVRLLREHERAVRLTKAKVDERREKAIWLEDMWGRMNESRDLILHALREGEARVVAAQSAAAAAEEAAEAAAKAKVEAKATTKAKVEAEAKATAKVEAETEGVGAEEEAVEEGNGELGGGDNHHPAVESPGTPPSSTKPMLMRVLTALLLAPNGGKSAACRIASREIALCYHGVFPDFTRRGRKQAESTGENVECS